MNSPARIAGLYRYPVKGLSPERLESVTLSPGATFPLDRAWAIENGPAPFDPAAPKYLPKARFLMLMRNERLAALDTRLDDATTTLTIRRDGRIVATGRLDTADGRAAIEAFFDDYERDELRGPAKVLHAPGFSFSDVAAKVVSLINLDSVRDLCARIGADIHPLRFRGNLLVEGLPAWSELDLEGRRITVGGVVFKGHKRIVRCAATNVNPDTAARDMEIPRALDHAFGHSDCGLYLRVVEGGEIRLGDALSVELAGAA